jgi:hypothetical protein
MWNIWGRGYVHTGFLGEDSEGRDHLENLGIEGRIVLKCIFKK